MLMPKVVKNFFHEDVMYLIRKEIEWMKSGGDPEVAADREIFNRLHRHNSPFFAAIHEMITARASSFIGENVKPSYNFTSMYFTGEGKCPFHTDREQCKFTVDLCVNQNEPWPINIAGRDYILHPGDAVIYSGTDHLHGREAIQPGNYCDLVFFHFVPLSFRGNLY